MFMILENSFRIQNMFVIWINICEVKKVQEFLKNDHKIKKLFPKIYFSYHLKMLDDSENVHDFEKYVHEL